MAFVTSGSERLLSFPPLAPRERLYGGPNGANGVLYEIGAYLTDIYDNLDQQVPGPNAGLKGLLRRGPKTDPLVEGLRDLMPEQGRGYEKAILRQAGDVLEQLEVYGAESGYDRIVDVRYSLVEEERGQGKDGVIMATYGRGSTSTELPFRVQAGENGGITAVPSFTYVFNDQARVAFHDPRGPVEFFQWGKYTIVGEEHTKTPEGLIGAGKDVRLIGHEATSWAERKGHKLTPEMITDVYDRDIEVLVIGNGVNSAVEVPDEVREAVESHGLELIIERSQDACLTYNEMMRDGRKAALLVHGTC